MIEKLRQETDGVKKVIHFNNAGSSLPPNIVRDSVIDYLHEEALHGGYEVYEKYASDYEQTYELIAQLINANKEEIALLENATVAWNAAFQAINFKDGDEVITNQCDYASNYLSYLHHQKELVVRVIPNLDNGDPDLAAFERLINTRTKLVAITHMPTNSGLLSPAEEIGTICKKHSLLYLLDACQTAGQYPLDVEKIGCHMLSATGRKYLRAPRGTGFLYVNKEKLSQLRPHFIDLHSAIWTGKESYEIRNDARKFENWEGNRGAIIGLNRAVAYAMEVGVEAIWDRVQYLADKLRTQMRKLPQVQVHDEGSVLGGILSFTVDGMTAIEVKDALFQKGINVSWNGIPNTYLDMTKRGLNEIIRASVHYYNTEHEIEQFIEELSNLNS